MFTPRTLWIVAIIYNFFALLEASNIGATRQDILHDITDGGYSKILVAIDAKVVEDVELITAIQVSHLDDKLKIPLLQGHISWGALLQYVDSK